MKKSTDRKLARASSWIILTILNVAALFLLFNGLISSNDRKREDLDSRIRSAERAVLNADDPNELALAQARYQAAIEARDNH